MSEPEELSEPENGAPDAIEVTARFVGTDFDLRDVLTPHPVVAVVGFGTDRNGSGVLRLWVDAHDRIEACQLVTRLLLEIGRSSSMTSAPVPTRRSTLTSTPRNGASRSSSFASIPSYRHG